MARCREKKGVYKIPDSKLENAIQLGIKEGVTPLIILNYGNSNYKENTGGHKNIRLSSDEEIEGFINYVDWVSKHFGKKKIILRSGMNGIIVSQNTIIIASSQL